ncbi:hypothetical protein WHR41_03664 [Cladosporium halotolerans]|uniref:Uncharacterized protein n=1 Tax=Cladosporium halotolerans TaxID=1052096 RepID=A0AB34KRQ5_9PEZI
MVDDFRPFAVYKTQEVNLDLRDLIKDSLVAEDVDAETWKAILYSPARPTDILATHRDRNDVNQGFLLIADRQDVLKEGLLCVNLNYKGAPDAVREKAHELCYALPSLSIDNTDWKDDVLANASLPLYPRNAFAILVDLSAAARRNVADIADTVDGGLVGRHRDTGTILAEWDGVNTSDVSAMASHFTKSRVEKDWRGDYFLCIRESTVEVKKVEIVNARTQKCRTFTWETAGEALVWLTVGLIREEELDEPGKLIQKYLFK